MINTANNYQKTISFTSHEHKEVALEKLKKSELEIKKEDKEINQKANMVKKAIERGLNRLDQEKLNSAPYRQRYEALKNDKETKRGVADGTILNSNWFTAGEIANKEILRMNTESRKNRKRLAALKQLQEEIDGLCGDLDKRKNKALEALKGFKVYNPKATKYDELAETLLNLCFDTTERSKHTMKEFSSDKNEYQEFLKALSPECKQNSLDIKNALGAIPELNDPMSLMIIASKMEKMTANVDPGQLGETIQGIKDFVVTRAEKNVATEPNTRIKTLINDMSGIIKENDSDLRFGKEFKLLLNQALDIENNPTPQPQEERKIYATDYVRIPKTRIQQRN